MSREKMTLPFEVSYSEKPSKKSKNMKRLAVIVKPESLDETISSLKEMGLDATIYDVKRATKEKKERVASGRGSGTLELAYTTRKIVATVVNSDDVDEVAERMKKALGGDKAVLMIQPVDDLVVLWDDEILYRILKIYGPDWYKNKRRQHKTKKSAIEEEYATTKQEQQPVLNKQLN